MANLIETEITSTKPELTAQELVVSDTSEFSMLFDTARFNQSWRVAKVFADSKLVPAHFQGNTAGVFVVLHLATRMNLDPFTAMQKIYVIQGKPGIEAQLVIALVNARGPFFGPIQYKEEGEGDNRKWTAYATHAKTGELCEAVVTWDMVKKEGWASKTGSKWMTMPSMMGRYRAATFLARLFCPEVILGLSTVDELKDMDAEVIEVTGEIVPHIPQTEKIKEKLKRGKKDAEASPEPPAAEKATDAPSAEKGGVGGGTLGPRGITDKTWEKIQEVAVQKNYPTDMILADYEVTALAELTEESGANVLTFLATLPDVD